MDIVALVKHNKKIAGALGIIIILIFLGGIFSINPLANPQREKPKTKAEPASFKVTTQEIDEKDATDFSDVTTEEMKQQAKDDSTFAEAVNELSKEYDWFNHVPIREKEFIIVYDYEKKQFRLALQIPGSSPQEKIDEITNKALGALKNIGVDPNKEGFYTTFKD